MNTLWRKAMRDLLGERFRSASIIVALSLGIAGFLAVLSMYAILTKALNDGYNATNPASAILMVDRADDPIVQAVAAMPGIKGAEARRMIRGRIKTGPAQWQSLLLFSRRDFAASHIGTVALQGGDWPLHIGEIAIERDALQLAHAKIGDGVTLQTENGREHSLRVTGSIHDVGQAQARMENTVYGYVTLEALSALGEDPYYNELAIRVSEQQLNEEHIREIADKAAQSIKRSGFQVTGINIPEPGQHPHAKLMGTLLISIAVFGFFILALSGVIVFNVLTALMAGQSRQIGVMKALGGSRFQITRVYLLEAGVLGLGAVGVSLPIGLAGSRWLSQWMAGFLNFNIATFAVPFWVYALVFVVGVAVPIISAILPVWAGTRVSVREALTPNSMLGRIYGTSIVDRALSRVGGLSRVVLLAIRNAGRNRLRVGLTLVTLATGGIFYMSALNVRQALINTIDRFYAKTVPDLLVTLATDYSAETVEQACHKVAGVSVAEGWILAKGKLPGKTGENNRENEITVFGMPIKSSTMVFEFTFGKGLDESGRSVVVNTSLFDKLGRPAIGDEVHFQIEGKEASLKLAGVAYEAFAPPNAYVSGTFFNDRPQAKTARRLRIMLENPTKETLEAAKQGVEANFRQKGITAVEARTKAETRIVLDEHMVMIYVFLFAVSFILGGVGAVGLITTVNLSVTERRREMGVLRAIGATPVRVAQIVVIEGVAVGAISWLISVTTVMPLSNAIGNFMLRTILKFQTEIAITMEPKGLMLWLAVALIGSALASFWPAMQTARASVRETLTYE